METRITATELARNLSDILNRVRYRRESFRVERNGEVVALLEPSATNVFTVADFRRKFGGRHVPEGFGTDLEKLKADIQPLPAPPSWAP